jgi:hypothetical protein
MRSSSSARPRATGFKRKTLPIVCCIERELAVPIFQMLFARFGCHGICKSQSRANELLSGNRHFGLAKRYLSVGRISVLK